MIGKDILTSHTGEQFCFGNRGGIALRIAVCPYFQKRFCVCHMCPIFALNPVIPEVTARIWKSLNLASQYPLDLRWHSDPVRLMSCCSNNSVGTTVSLSKIFQNIPVRRSCLQVNKEKERILSFLRAISMAFPAISFSLFDLSQGTLIFNAPKVLRECHSPHTVDSKSSQSLRLPLRRRMWEISHRCVRAILRRHWFCHRISKDSFKGKDARIRWFKLGHTVYFRQQLSSKQPRHLQNDRLVLWKRFLCSNQQVYCFDLDLSIGVLIRSVSPLSFFNTLSAPIDSRLTWKTRQVPFHLTCSCCRLGNLLLLQWSISSPLRLACHFLWGKGEMIHLQRESIRKASSHPFANESWLDLSIVLHILRCI